MSKALKIQNLSQRSATRSLLAVSLTFALTAFGCTTDRNLGNGDPVTTPGIRTAPTGGGSVGSESTSSTPQSMTSSGSARFDALPAVTPRNRTRLSADQAAAIMSQYQSAPRVRVLGPAMPGEPGRAYASDAMPTGQFRNPALITNPQVTVNSTISSSPTPVIASGSGDAGGGGGIGITGAATAFGTSTGGSVTGTTNVTAASTLAADDAAAPIFTSTPVSPTASAAATLPAGAFAAGTGTLTPTAAAAINPGVTAASNLAPRNLATATRATTTANTGLSVGGNVNATTTANPTNVSANATTTGTTTSGTTSNAGALRRTTTNTNSRTTGTVRILTDDRGHVTVTNQ